MLGLRSKFIATGQTGLMLEGDGVALDAVRVDFAAGAVEQLVMRFGQYYGETEKFMESGDTKLVNPSIRAIPTHIDQII